MEFWYKIIYIILLILLPIVPAFLFYKYLPDNKTVMKGPFKGMKVKLEGAFAAYFLTLIFLGGFCKLNDFLPKDYKLCTIMGKIQLKNEQFDKKNLSILVEPPDQDVYEDGRFFLKKILLRNKEPDKVSFRVHKNGFKSKTIIICDSNGFQNDTTNYQIQYKKGTPSTIKIKKPIILEQAPKIAPYKKEEAIQAIPIGEGIK